MGMSTSFDRRDLCKQAMGLGVIGGLALMMGESVAQADEANEEKNEHTSADAVESWADAVTSASVATNMYTDLDAEQLVEVINAYQAVCMFATTNEDGTPNIAVFSGGYALDETYLIFNWYDNQTKANLERTHLGMIGYDVADLAAEEKTGRHQGALVKVELVDDEELRAELAAMSPYIVDETVIVKIVELLPIG